MSTLEQIKIKLIQTLSPSYLEVNDDSALHVGHPGAKEGGGHYTIVIAASALQEVSRVEAHRKIYAILKDFIPEKIHALKIIIKPVSHSS